jgi:transcriptional regulator
MRTVKNYKRVSIIRQQAKIERGTNEQTNKGTREQTKHQQQRIEAGRLACRSGAAMSLADRSDLRYSATNISTKRVPMYIPKSFQVAELATLQAVIRRYSFATLISTIDGVPFATHLPLLLRESPLSPYGALVGHLARANPQWRHFADRESLVIFQGPHSYISPSWYPSAAVKPTVPTWNYVTVHAYGIPQIRDDAEWLAAQLDDLIATYEAAQPQPWPALLPDEYRAAQIKAIVGFELVITRLEGKFKLGQNRAPADQQGVFAALSDSPYPESRELAQFMPGLCAIEAPVER